MGGAAGSGGQAGAAANATKTPARITWLAWAGAGPETEQYEQNVATFQQAQPVYTVDFVNAGTLDATNEKFITMAAAGQAPDVVQAQYAFCVDLASRGTLAGLDSHMARDRVKREEFIPGEIDEFAWKKVQYGLPKDNALRVMFLNLDLFDKAGVKSPADSWTWDDFVDLGKRLTNRNPPSGPTTFGVADFPYSVNDSPSYSITRAFGGEWYNATWTAATIDAAPTVESIQFTADWRNKYKISPAPGEITGSGDAFRQGRVAMGIQFAQQVFFLKDEKVSFRYDVVPLPRGKAGAFPCATGSGESLAKDAKSPEAGWQLIKYVTGPEAQKRVTSLKRWGSSRVDTLEAILPTDGVPKNFRAAFIDPLQGKTKDKPVAIPTPPRARDLQDIFKREFAPVLSGDKTAKDAAATAKPLMDEIMRTAGGR
jgi:multiple sugar transport system substrate-binding protein